MTVIYNNILEAMGNTPLIRLERMAEEESAQILVKFEGLNVGGSIKTRTAYNMIRDAEEKNQAEIRALAWRWSEQCGAIRRKSSCLIQSVRNAGN